MSACSITLQRAGQKNTTVSGRRFTIRGSLLYLIFYRLVNMIIARCIMLQKYPSYALSVSGTASASSNVSRLMRLLYHFINFLNSAR